MSPNSHTVKQRNIPLEKMEQGVDQKRSQMKVGRRCEERGGRMEEGEAGPDKATKPLETDRGDLRN